MISKLAFAAALSTASAGYVSWGSCPDMPEPVGNFDADAYAGNWYEIYRDKDVWYE